jgi:Heparinase II/III-like protein/Heparinase II/III N-terminus
MNLAWYVRRLASMAPSEVVGRARDVAVQQSWRRRQVHRMADDTTPVPASVAIDLKAPPIDGVNEAAVGAVVAAADELLMGRWLVFDRWRDDMAPSPDWHRDPRTGRRAPSTAFCFGIDHRDEAAVGNVKYVWEASRHVQCTVLAAAYHLTGDERYASAAARQLRSWWHANPFLSGIHWTSGIELGLRLIAWVWVRRMLDGWEPVRDLFERDPVFLRQLRHHQEWLATFPSRGSSANNHLIAEAAGQFAAAAAFDVFGESGTWREQAAARLRRALTAQVDTSGLHRELATEYHAFVLELVLVAAVEGEVAGHGLGDEVWHTLCRMVDCLAAIVDDEGHPPRQGDADDGHGLVVDAPGNDRWSSLLATGAHLFGPLPWWPDVTSGDVRTAMFAGLVPSAPTPSDRPTARSSVLPAAGQVFLRDVPGHPAPVWCRFDAGPHGMAGIAAHAHADALSIEVRVGGVDLLVDPGTYCYHGEPAWRSYFRSTRGHNTLEIGDRDQSDMGGPFLWTRSVDARLLSVHGLDDGTIADSTAEHDGYTILDPPAIHRRTIRFHRGARWLRCIDEVETDGRCTCRLSFHLGPHVSCTLDATVATLSWTAEGVRHTAYLELAAGLRWAARNGEVEPIAGWYSPAFGQRVPTTVLVGEGVLDGASRLVTVLHLDDAPTATARGPVGGGAGAATT